jgi:hypothetical protein
MYGMWYRRLSDNANFCPFTDIPLTPLIYEAIPAMHYNSSPVSCI